MKTAIYILACSLSLLIAACNNGNNKNFNDSSKKGSDGRDTAYPNDNTNKNDSLNQRRDTSSEGNYIPFTK